LKSRAFRRLPPNIQELAGLAKKWCARKYPHASDIDSWYDGEGYELNADTGVRLTDAEIDEEWERWGDCGLGDFKVEDIPIPAAGFADPDTWEPKPEPEEEEEYEGPTEADLIRDIGSRGREYTAKHYRVPMERLSEIASDEELARAIYDILGGPRPAAGSAVPRNAPENRP
jgi:hypothetical protein